MYLCQKILLLIALLFITEFGYAINPTKDNSRALDSLHRVLKDHSGSDSKLALAYNNLRALYFNVNSDSSIFYGLKAVKLYKEIGSCVELGAVYWNLGEAFPGLITDSSLKYFELSIKSLESCSDTTVVIHGLLRFGEYLHRTGHLSIALKKEYKALELSTKIGDTVLISESHHMLGNAFKRQFDYKKAFDHYSQELKLIIPKNLRQLSHNLMNRSQCLIESERYKDALILALQSDSIMESINEKYRSMPNLYISICYNEMGVPEKANEFFLKSIEFGKSEAKNYELSLCAVKYGQFLFQNNQFNQALENAYLAYNLSKSYGFVLVHEEALDLLISIFRRYNQKDSTLSYMEELFVLKDSINAKAKIVEARNLTSKVEAAADSLILVEERIQADLRHEIELGKKNQTRNLLLGSALLLILVSIALYSRMNFVKKANVKLEKAKNKAERLGAFKQQFLANMSHEIRTPMNAILGMTNLTLDTHLTDKQKEYLSAVKKSTENLLVVINDILDLSKLEAGKMDLELIPFNLKEQLQIVFDTLKFKAEEKGLEFKIHVDDSTPKFVKGDPYRLNQILLNLCGNSIKFTDKGSVVIHVSKSEIDDYLRFSVVDTGIGIPKDKAENLFSAFQQAEKNTSRIYGGTGLGLSISKTLVEMQNGQIGVNSAQDEGSEFYFTLPLELASKQDIEDLAKENLIDVSNLKGIKILLAEDNKFNQVVLHDTIMHLIEDAKVDVAENGKIAVDMLANKEYNLVLMDINMPVMTGHEAAKFIREELKPSKNTIPILALTASILKEDIKSFEQSGMNDFIPKPFTREELLSTLGKYYNSIS